jgi:hypothetical protein
MLLVLVPVPTAEHCLLSEAVEYAALRRLPLNCNPILKFIPMEMGWQEREDFRWQQAVSDYASEVGLRIGYVPSRTFVPPGKYEASGLGPLIDATGQLPIHGDNGAPLDERYEKYEVFLDGYRIQVLNLLHEGRLTARGKKLPKTIGIDVALDIDPPVESAFESISREFWASANVRWIADCAQGRSATYKFIQLVTDDLFKALPLPDSRPASDVVQMGDNFIFSGELREETEMFPLTGRPPVIKWDEFHVEVAKRVKEDMLPEKKEAFIADMQAWCRNRWGREVGRSTVSQKIKPYYDEFMRQRMPENDP